MKKTLKALAVLICALLVMFAFVACGETPSGDDDVTPTQATQPTETEAPTPTEAEIADPTETEAPTPTEAPTSFDQSAYDAIASENKVSAADIFEDGNGVIAWWDNYPRFSGGSVEHLLATNADADHTGSRNDEGRGPFARAIDALSGVPKLEQLHSVGLKGGAWIELQGDSRNFMMALHQLEDGSFEIDQRTGAARMMAWVWGWTGSSGPLQNADANYIVWSGVHSFVNNEEWAEPYTIQNYPEMNVPTYPDGTPAQGYLEGGDRTTPHLATFYDACGAKDLNGSVIRFDELGLSSGDTTYALKLVDGAGNEYYTDDFAIGKDSSASFWLEYSINSVNYWVEQGVDFFWIDNWNGWDNINNRPLKKAFGDWSEYKFKAYLAERPEIGVTDTENFEIVEYLKQKATEILPGCDPNDISYSNPVWNAEDWIEDPIWLAYLAFKSKENTAYNSAVFTAIKDASERVYGDRDYVAVCANDFPHMTFGACDGDYLDIVSTEYSNDYSSATGFSTSGYPPNSYSGHAYGLIANIARAHNAVLWYYQNNYTDNMGKVFGYEALAYNCLLHNNFAGTTASNTLVNGSIEKLKDIFSDRRIYAEIGVVFSADSETSYLAPGGFATGEKIPHNMAYMGWCHAFDELNVPYKSIPMDRIADMIGDCSLVMLPEVRSISADVVNNVIIPFLDNGGTVVITGANAGALESLDNDFVKREEPILVKLANEYNGNGKVIYMETDLAIDYFTFNKGVDFETIYDFALLPMEEEVKSWYDNGYINNILTIDGFDASASIISTLNFSKTEKTFFVDLVNMQYDTDTDVLSETPAMTVVKVRVPSTHWGYDFTVSLYTDNTDEIVALTEGTDYTVDGAYISVNVPQFTTYATVIIDR